MNSNNSTNLKTIDTIETDFSAIRVLVVEDDKINQFLNHKILVKMGFNADVAGNGDEAMEKLINADYDIILMDLRLPGKDGIETTRLIRQMPQPKSNIPVFAITSSVAFTVRQEAEHAGINEYFTKPCNPQELKDMILKYISGRV